jgi:hypothetical protein
MHDAKNCAPRKNFTQISNNVLDDPNLSLQAKGLLTLLHRNKSGWVTYMEGLKKMSTNGETSIRSAMQELWRAGYLAHMVYRDVNKRFIIGSFLAYTDEPFNFDFTEHIEEGRENGWIITLNPKLYQGKNQDNGAEELKPDFQVSASVNSANRALIRLIQNNTNFDEEKETTESKDSVVKSGDEDPPDRQLSSLTSISSQALNNASSKTQSSAENTIRKRAKSLNGKVSDSELIIQYWNMSGLRQVTPEKMKDAVKKLDNLLLGQFFRAYPFYSANPSYDRPYTKEEIIAAIDNHKKAALDINYYPVDPDKKKRLNVSLCEWLYNQYWLHTMQKSMFVNDLETPPRLVSADVNLVEDVAEKHTNALKMLFVKNALGGIEPNEWTTYEENAFRNAGFKLKSFFDKNRKKLTSYAGQTIMDQARYVFEALEVKLDGNWKGVTPGWLSNETVYNVNLPNYLSEQALIRTM